MQPDVRLEEEIRAAAPGGHRIVLRREADASMPPVPWDGAVPASLLPARPSDPSQRTSPRAPRATGDEPAPTRVGRTLQQLVLVLLVSAVLGGATSFAQGLLPDPLRPFANSASGWTLLTALTVALCRARAIPSAVFGAGSFAALVLGYQVVSGLRGSPTDETLFLAVGVVVGPFIGAAASWLHRGPWRAAVGCAVLAGVALGEGVFGLLRLAETTGWFYWTAIGVVGLGLLVHTLIRRLPASRSRILAIALTVAVGGAFFGAYSALSGYVPDRTDPALRTSAAVSSPPVEGAAS